MRFEHGPSDACWYLFNVVQKIYAVCNFENKLCLEAGFEDQLVNIKLSLKTFAFLPIVLFMFVWILHSRECCLHVCLVCVFA